MNSENNKIWVYWEGEMPSVVKACIETIELHNEGLTVLNENTIYSHLPELRNLADLCPAHRADYIRLALLWEYGGCWMDADCVCIKPLAPAFDLMGDYDFLGFKVNGRVKNPIMFARPKSSFIAAALKEADHILDTGSSRVWRTLGENILTQLSLKSGYNAKFVERWKFAAIPHSESDAFLTRKKDQLHQARFNPNAFSYHLTHGAVIKLEDLLSGRDPASSWTFFSFLLRKSRGVVFPPRAQAITSRFKKHQDLIGVEVGVLGGRNSSILLEQLPKLKLFMVDIWAPFPADHSYCKSNDANARHSPEKFNRLYLAARERVRFAGGRANLIKSESTLAVTQVPDELDFVFIDGDHSYDGVKADLAAWWPKVRSGGLICGHDYTNSKKNGWGVDLAVNEFVSDKGLDLELDRDHTWFAVKK